jgi:hypothetical protein
MHRYDSTAPLYQVVFLDWIGSRLFIAGAAAAIFLICSHRHGCKASRDIYAHVQALHLAGSKVPST